jgi:uncharacterized protein (TIGR02099 family)
MSQDVKLSFKDRSFGIIASIINGLWKIIALSIIIISIVIASARLFSGEFSRFKPEVEAYLSDQLKRPVSIKSLTLEWPAKGPRILLKDLKIETDLSKNLNSLIIANGDVAINLWESIFYLDWVTEGIDFQGIQAIVNPEIKETVSTFNIDDNQQLDTQLQAGVLNEWLLRQATIEIYDSYLLLVSDQKQKLSYALPVLTYHGGENRRQLSAHAVTSSGSELEIKSEVSGQKTDPKRIIDLYISGQKINLEDFPASVLRGNLAQFSGLIDIEVWSQWKGNLLDNIVAKVAADEISNISSKDKFSLSPFELVFQRSDINSWAFATSKLAIKVNQKKLQPFELYGKNEILPESGDEKWNITGLDIPIEMVGSLSKSYLPDNLQQWLSQSKPQGEIDNLTASIIFPKVSTKKNATLFELAFDLKKFSSIQWEKIPGVSNLTAKIKINQDGFSAKLDSSLGDLDLSPTFRYPLHFNHLSGTLNFSNDSERKVLVWDNFFFDSEEIQVKSTGKIEYPKQGDGYLEIVALIENGDTSLTPWFLPVSVMSSNLVSYLDEGVHNGRLTTATAIARGPFSSFPFQNYEGVFDIRANIEGVNFRFQPEWPAIDDLAAELRFFGDSMFIEASSGTLSGVKINKATAAISQLSDPKGSLIIHAEASNQDQNAMDLLSRSPLKTVSDSLEILEFRGKMKTTITMEIALDGSKIPNINGKVNFNKNSILLKTPNVPFNQIIGELNFDEDGLTTSKLKGKLWDKDFSFDIKAKTTNTKTEYTGIFESELSNLGINNLSGINSELFVNGTTALKGELGLVIDAKDKQSEMTLDFFSNLQGLNIDVPGIINKNDTDKLPLEVGLKIKGKKITLKGDLNKKIQLLAEHTEEQWKGSISNALDQQQTLELPEKKIWNTELNTSKIDLLRWFDLLSNIQNQKSNNPKNQTHSAFHVKLNTEDFSAVGYEFGKTQIVLEQDDSFFATILAKDIDAKIDYSYQPGEPLQMTFNKLHLQSERGNLEPENTQIITKKEDSQEISLSKLNNVKPSDISHIKINCISCRYGNQDIGKIEIEVIPAGDKLGILGKWYQDKLFENNFIGIWNQMGTQISGKLISNDVDAFSNFWEIASGVKQSSLQTSFALNWQGSPWDISSNTLNGKITSNLSQGHIEEVNTKGAQLFSFLSLQNLKRRLTLDFNDVFKEGFYFDKISATFIIKNGLAYSAPVKIDGTAADIEISGYTDLVNSEFNQYMVVTPKLSSSLPVLAGWAISPATAVLALVLDKMLLKPALDVVTRIDYKISGPWEKPEIIEVGKQQKEIQIEDQPQQTKKEEPRTLPDTEKKP